MTYCSAFGARDNYLKTGYNDITFAIFFTVFSLEGYPMLGYMESFRCRVQKKK
jgi:hypothetical protein